MKKILSPSILSANLYNLSHDIKRVQKHGINHIHFDVMDGHFVPNISYGAKILKDLKDAQPKLFVDAHLMISRPDIYWKDFVSAKADLVTFHIEALSINETKMLLKNIRDAGCQTGLAIKPNTDIQNLVRFIGMIDQVILMSVEPGFGGQKFMTQAISRAKELQDLRSKYGASFTIMVDGGINAETSKLIGPYVDILVSGSYIFGAEDIEQAIKSIENCCG